jgi:hypothetical protein
MKKRFIVSLLLIFGWIFLGSVAWAIDTGWMQKGVRVWYFGAASTGFSSDAEEAYLFSSINGNNAQITHHSAINHWASPNTVDFETDSILDKGPCWIHPQKLQTLASGDTWKGQEIVTVLPDTYTYDTLKNEFPSIPYLLLPIKTLFDLNPQRDLVKIVYMLEDFSTGIAYFDVETGLLLLYETSDGFVTVFFFLSEINYDFETQTAFAEDDGPHTGFKSNALETTTASNYVFIQALVETRYGDTVQMWTASSAGGSTGGSILPPNENYCFFGSVPVLRNKNMTSTPYYPPEQWNEYGEYLWWWVPQEALQRSIINIFGVSMERTSTAPYTFTSTETGTGLYFTKLIFNDAGYMTTFFAKDTDINLDFNLGSINSNDKNTSVDGLAYYKNNMGIAEPEPGFSPTVTTSAASAIGTTSAALNGTVNPNGNTTSAHFEYGLTASYGTNANVTLAPSDGTSAQNVSAVISNLQAGATYHFRLTATNGHGTVNSNDAIFSTTAPGSLPAVNTSAASSIATTAATLNGTVNPNGDTTAAHFEYGLTTAYGTAATVILSPSNGSSAQNVSAIVSSLQAGTTYHFRIVATNSHGTVNSGDATFNTTSSNNGGGSSNDSGGGGGGGGGIFGAISVSDVIGYHLDGVMKNGVKIYMPVTNGYKALKGAQTHVEKFAPGLAKLIRGGFESIELVAEGRKDGILYRIGTYTFPVLGKIAELYLGAVGSHELMANAYSATMISIAEFNKLHQQGVAVSPHIVKGRNR